MTHATLDGEPDVSVGTRFGADRVLCAHGILTARLNRDGFVPTPAMARVLHQGTVTVVGSCATLSRNHGFFWRTVTRAFLGCKKSVFVWWCNGYG